MTYLLVVEEESMMERGRPGGRGDRWRSRHRAWDIDGSCRPGFALVINYRSDEQAAAEACEEAEAPRIASGDRRFAPTWPTSSRGVGLLDETIEEFWSYRPLGEQRRRRTASSGRTCWKPRSKAGTMCLRPIFAGPFS